MFRKLFLIALLSLPFLPFASFAEDDKPVVIALAPFCDFSGCPNTPHIIMSLRDKISANLLQNYNCVILSRSNGMILSVEKSLGGLNNMEGKPVSENSFPAADYSIVSYFKIARRTPGKNNSVDLGCTLLVTDLQNDDERNYKKIEFLPNEPTLYADDVTKEIVKALKLKPRTKKLEIKNEKIDETWAVLPVKRLDTKNAMKGSGDKDLAISMELALQDSSKLKQIVDHSEIDKILNELQISSMSGATESAAGSIAQLVGADKVIMGSVSKVHMRKPDLRLDLFLVDGRKAIILDTATAVCRKDKINEKAAELVLNFTNSKHTIPEFVFANDKCLKKEAEIYSELLLNMGNNNSRRDVVEPSVSFAETLYLLDRENQSRMLKVGEFLAMILEDELPLKQRSKLCELTLKVLKDVKFSEESELVLLTQASACKYVPDRIEEGIALAQRHLKEHPDVNPRYAKYIIGDCYFRKKDYKQALKFAEESGTNIGGCRLRAKLYQIFNDPANDEKELEALDHLRLTRELHGKSLIRKLQLLRKLKGADTAYRYSRRIHAWSLARPEVQLEIAKINIDLGKKEFAAILLSDLDSRQSMKQCGYSERKEHEKLLVDIRALRKELNIIPEKPKKLSEFYKIPSKYKLYIIPIGDPDMELINQSITATEIFLGCRVELLPGLAIPEDPVCFKKSRGQYDASRVLQRVRNSLEIPNDAISVVLVTGKDIFTDDLRFVYSTSYNGLRIISYSKWYAGGDKHILTEMLAKTICDAFMINANLYGCPVNSCLNSSSGTALGAKRKSFAVCSLCQKKLAVRNADYVYRRFRNELNDKYSLADNDKQEWMDEYKRIVKDTLAKAKKKTDKKQATAVNYLPSVKIDSPQKGLKYKYYELEPKLIKQTEKLSELTPKETGVAKDLDLAISKRDNHFGIIFEGYIKIPVDGEYQFYLSSGGGFDLFIGDEKVIFNRGQRVKSKYCQLDLKAGYHPIRIQYYFDFTPWKDKNGELIKEKFYRFMELYYRGPGIYTQKIPQEVLFHEE